ncbi:FHA domain-containing protein, partial [Candidatus Poribacteria bacterium]|nr:FHA domain-containing protein [Candidatus Poribacteria bacterium]
IRYCLLYRRLGDGYKRHEVRKAEMLEIHTRRIRGERLSRKQTRLLKASEQYPELDPLKDLIDFAHHRFEERENVTPLPGAKRRIANNLMQLIGRDAPEDDALLGDEISLVPAYSPDLVGSDSELALPNISGDLPPPIPESIDPLNETVILEGEAVESATSPVEACHLKLQVAQGDEVGREYDISFQPMIIGCGGEVAVQLDANTPVSQRHALLTVDDDELLITNLDSDSGTSVDGAKVTEPTTLHVASRVQIGGQVLEVAAFRRDASVLGVSFEVVEGPDVGQVHWVHFKEMTVGRSAAAQIKLADSTGTLSRLHARFNLKNGEVYLTDLGSKNGTYVDGFRIEEPTVVEPGMRIGFSEIVCEVTHIEHI